MLARHRARLPALLLMVGLLTGCASVTPLAENHSKPASVPAAVVARFCYDRQPTGAVLELADEKRHFDIYKGSFQSGIVGDDDPEPVTFEYYRPDDEKPVPVALVLPILNGKKHIVRPFASYFARHGYAAIIVDSRQRTRLEKDLLDPQASIRGTVLRHRRMLDWVDEQPELDSERIVVFGASLGGFNALYLAALDDRISAVVPALAAADLPYVFAHSTEPRIESAAARVREQLELDPAEFETYLRDNIETSIADLAAYIDGYRVQMVLARRDKAVPVDKQRELRAALGEPETVMLPTGHLTSALFIFSLRKRALRFFDRILAAEPAGRTVTFEHSACAGAVAGTD